MSRTAFLGLLIAIALPSIASAQLDAHSARLNRKTSWSFHTSNGIETLSGRFLGINNNIFQVIDADGFKHRIPIDALVADDRDLFWEFRDWTGVSLPGEHARRMTNSEYASYVQRLVGRRTEALYERRQRSLYHGGSASSWTALRVPFSPLFAGTGGRPAIEQGIIAQPPIPRPRGRVFVFPRY